MDSCKRCGVGIEGGYYCQTCGQILAKRRERRNRLDNIKSSLLTIGKWLIIIGFWLLILVGELWRTLS